MISNNYYPVKFKEFLRIKSIGNYVVMYAMLKDRIHFEMAVENAVFVTQRFLIDVEEEIQEKAINYDNDPIKIFLKMSLSGSTFYRYYPSADVVANLRKIKLYDKIVIKESKSGEYDPNNIQIIETDTYMRALDGAETILFGEKE